MQIRVVTAHPWDVSADVLAVPVADDDGRQAHDAAESGLAELDRRLEGALAEYRRVGELTSKPHASALLRATGLGADWLVGMGIGRAEDFDRLAALRLGAAIERRLGGRSVRSVAVWLPETLGGRNGSERDRSRGSNGWDRWEPLDQAGFVELVVRGIVEGSHEPAAIYREQVDGAPPELDELIIVVPGGDEAPLARAAERGRVIGEGSNRTRTLAQRASNDVSPDVLADEASAIARAHDLQVEVLGPQEAAEMGMNLFLAVGRGSDNPPRFIVLRSGDARQRDSLGRLLALIGKGVTFDSGGISIKPAERMEEMKMDKTGACTVLSAIATAAQLAPGIPLIALAPAVENMPGPHSTRPGDVVRAMNGKLVEIQNTDAEGRLILGDALTYAERQGATHLVDVATLTGAVERAFGKLVTGAFATPSQWYDEVARAGARQGERLWQVPLVEDYVPELDSWYADFPNTGGNEGALVKSGLFLQQFVTRPWAHLDIGGTAYLRKATPWAARGATGVTHATLVELALQGA
ncbi:MAG: leucyl aminopeptidase [Chloroflexota bacterium]|nr:leucyl aminopeptidase [Chloroflexota bacterium]